MRRETAESWAGPIGMWNVTKADSKADYLGIIPVTGRDRITSFYALIDGLDKES